MNTEFTKTFQKNFIALSSKNQERFEKRLSRYAKNPKDPSLKDHGLKGSLLGYRAFSVTGDIRVIYKRKAKETIKLLKIGSHNKVYK